MGKTYVALAVIASVVSATRGVDGPVVVMVPRGLLSKWPREWDNFKAVCCTPEEDFSWVNAEVAKTPTDFLRLLGNRAHRRCHIVWTTTGCFDRGLSDGWVKLALVRLARSRTKMKPEQVKRLCKWAGMLVRFKSKRHLTPRLVGRLLETDLPDWPWILRREGLLGDGEDDPLLRLLWNDRERINTKPIADVLRGTAIPGRRGGSSLRRLNLARKEFNNACQQVYSDWLAKAHWHSPLLVLDEAHHAKNDQTRLASLFRSQETQRLVEAAAPGKRPLLWEKFDRMLFLTATPFQLGHHELIRVLRSFASVKWTGNRAPARSRQEFLGAMDGLEKRLNENRLAGRRLDRLWGRLAPDVVVRSDDAARPGRPGAEWWRGGLDGIANEVERSLIAAIEECRKTKACAEDDDIKPWHALRRWVIRHNRPTNLAPGAKGVPRRALRPGDKVLVQRPGQSGSDESTDLANGLRLKGDAALPFLLAARAQGELAQSESGGRAFFAEGLCSSYEAFHHTRDKRGDVRDVDDDGVEQGKVRREAAEDVIVPARWYESQVGGLIPSRGSPEAERFRHPKIQPVVERVIDLWQSGEKVLIFCFYRETARALRDHISREAEKRMLSLAAGRLGIDPVRNEARIRRWFELVARRLADVKSPFHEAIMSILRTPLDRQEFAILGGRENDLVQLLAAYVRSPSFIARYLPLDNAEVRDALWNGSKTPSVVRKGARALERALKNQTDASATSMLARVEEFLLFARELAGRTRTVVPDDGEPEDGTVAIENREPLAEYIDAIAVQMRGGDDESDQAETRDSSYRVLSPVRMVYGDTAHETRERVMLAFNSPMFPEILISSAVLGEGVDLHRFCRHVIHHDLCWNPSTLEQRTGRLDRIRCKAERSGRSIVVFEPFLAGSADEKMFRVVKDRERWFQIVMGQKFEFSEAASERLANRVPLPLELAKELVFDLRRAVDEGKAEA